MINKLSRYVNGTIGQVKKDNNLISTYVYRNFRIDTKIDYSEYTFVEGDRVDILATKFLGDSKAWYRIMDINPEFSDPFDILPGEIIRIPSE